jgi:[ribosomal protein S18]-alanine N-acetyltransferase
MPVDVSSQQFSIRAAIDSDAHAIAQINDLSFKRPYELKTLTDYRKNTLRFTMVAEYQGQVVGFMCVRKQADQFYLGLLAVRPSHQRHGIGRTLVEWLIQALPRCGLKAIRLHTYTDPSGPQVLYKKMGFVVEGVTKDFYFDGSSALKMVFRLPVQSTDCSTRKQAT